MNTDFDATDLAEQIYACARKGWSETKIRDHFNVTGIEVWLAIVDQIRLQKVEEKLDQAYKR